jgi:hypothetical protein
MFGCGFIKPTSSQNSSQYNFSECELQASPVELSKTYMERFILDCKAKGMTKHSIETYQSNVLEFLTYNPEPRAVSVDHLRYYLEKLRHRQLSHATLKGYMFAVSS